MPKRANPRPTDSALSRTVTGASATATAALAERSAGKFVPDFYRTMKCGLTVSSIGIGTYLGDSDDETDRLYAEALRYALLNGVNVCDTAINYRCQRAERVIGHVLQELIGEGQLRRDEVVLCTKGGYLPLDTQPPASREEYARYVEREYIEPGIVSAEDLVGGGHSLAPGFLKDQLERSMRNLGVQHVDCYYIHNPEQQLAAVSPVELRKRLQAAFEMLESCVGTGTITTYGCATWHGLRLPAGSQGHLSLYDLVAIARDIAGDDHHFSIVQLPINLTMSEAVRLSTQRDGRGRLVSVIDAAADLGIDLVVSAPLLQGQLTRDLPTQVRDVFAGETDADRALGFVRSLPGVVTAAVGTKSLEHVTANLAGIRAS